MKWNWNLEAVLKSKNEINWHICGILWGWARKSVATSLKDFFEIKKNIFRKLDLRKHSRSLFVPSQCCEKTSKIDFPSVNRGEFPFSNSKIFNFEFNLKTVLAGWMESLS